MMRVYWWLFRARFSPVILLKRGTRNIAYYDEGSIDLDKYPI